MSDHTTRGIIPWFASNPVAANLLMVLIIALGVLHIGDLNKEAFPSLSPNRIGISIGYDSGAAQASEEGVAIPLEQSLQGITGVKNLTTVSTSSGVSTSIEMQDGYDIDTLLKDVKDKLDSLSGLPDEADAPVAVKATREEHALWIQLYGDTDRRTLQSLATELKNDLLTNQYINSVSITGWLDPTILIEVDKQALQAHGLTLADISSAINAESSPSKVATIRNESLYLHVRASSQAYLKQEFSQIPIKSLTTGAQLTLNDVALVKDTYDTDEFVLSRFNGHQSLALQVITTGADDITDSVVGAREVIDQWMENGRLPSSVSLTTWYDRSESINQRLELMVKNALTGILLVFVLLAIFLNITVAFWVAMGLPFIFFGTLYFMGIDSIDLTLNLFTTFGFIMALGIVVDDAVVVGESIYTVRKEEGDTLANTIKGTLRVAVPTLFGVFTTVAAFWALSNIEGRMGQLYSQFATVVAICLVLSVIESKIILPAHLAHLSTHRKPSRNPLGQAWSMIQHGADWGLQWFSQNLYRPAIGFSIRHRYAMSVVFLSIFAFVIAMPFTGAIRMSFFPNIPGDTIRASVSMYNDVSFGQTFNALMTLESTAQQADQSLRKGQGISGIKNLQVTSSGDQGGSLRVELDENAPYTAQAYANKWQQLAGTLEGVSSLRIRSQRETVDALRVEFRGNDAHLLNGAMGEFQEKLKALPAVTGVEENDAPVESRLAFVLNAQGRALGLTTADLASQVARNFDGQVVQKYQRDNAEIEVRIGYPEDDKESPANVMSTQIRLDDGTMVPLSSVASLLPEEAETRITRINSKRSRYLSAEVDKDAMSATEVVNYLQSAIVPELKQRFPSVDIYFSGEAEQREETQSSMINMFAIAMLLIYGLLAIPLKSYSQPLIIMMAIPFGIIGALLGHWFNDLSLGILSLNGIIALSGVVVNDSLLLTSRYNELRAEGLNSVDAIMKSCQGRLRAVLLTSLTTYAGLIPILGETSRQAQMLVPAAVSLAYGILFATAITLILIPVLLMIQEDARNLVSKFKRGIGLGTNEEKAIIS